MPRATPLRKLFPSFFLIITLVAATGSVAQSAPIVTVVSPPSGPVGTVVTITGTGFSTTAANNYVYFGAVRASVSVASATSLTATVPTGATLAPVSVMTGGLTGYSSAPFVVTFSGRRVLDSTAFAPNVDFLTHDPYNVCLGDIDGDGKPDLIVSNQFDTTISVFRNISTSGTINSGSLAPAVIVRVGRRPISITYADLDGDGKPDLVVPNFDASTISVLRNTSTVGSISFAAQVTFPTDPGSGPFNIAVQDLNADGKPDIAVANDVAGSISVYQNQSTPGSITSSSFATRVNIVTPADPFVQIADIDGDGKPDLISANWGNATLSVFRNLNTGGAISTASFAVGVTAATGANPFSIAVADFDKDGRPDLVTANESGGTASVIRNTSTVGTVSFAPKIDYTTGAGCRFSAVTDLDGDGKIDIAACNRVASTISLLKNQSTSGTISFLPAVNIGANYRIRNITAGDIDGDGQPELYTANEGTVGSPTNNVSVFRNLLGNGFTISASAGPNGTITPSGTITVSSGGNQSFTIAPNTGYHIDSVFVDGVSQGPIASYAFTNVTASHTIQAKFGANQLTITASAGANGLISPSGAVLVNYNTNQAFTMTPNASYHVDSVIVDGVNQGSLGSYTFTSVTANHTIRATFAINQFTITATNGPNGVISPAGAILVNSGSNQTFTITPNSSYHVDSVIVDGVNQGATGSFTFNTVTANHTIRATFAINRFTITATAGPNGLISPSGAVLVNSGSNQAFTITPNASYHVDSVIVDGVNQGATGSFTFSTVTANHTIRATFAINQFTITATAGTNGGISPSGAVLVNSGSNQAFTITPNASYHVDSVIVDGVNQGATGSFTFNNVTANHTIRTVFAINQFTITSTAGVNGVINPSGSVGISSGGSQSFTITPNASYHVDSVIVDGVNQGATGSFTFNNVTANHTIRATFAINQFTITATAGANGLISPSGSVVVNSGNNQTFTLTPNASYHVDSVIVDGVNQGPSGTFTFNNVTTNHSIRATFAINQFTISATAGAKGVISPSGSIVVNSGNNQTFTMTPNAGYHVDSVIVDGVNQGAGTSYTFTNVTANHSIRAVFLANAYASSVRLPLTATSAVASRNLFWGVHAGASAGIWGLPGSTAGDSVEGEFELPPSIGGVMDLRFVSPSGSALFGNGSLADFRDLVSASQTDSFQVAVQAGNGGLPMTLRWSKSLVAASFTGPVSMTDNLATSVDMKLTDSLRITNPSVTSVLIIAQSPALPVLFEQGWNLASVPVVTGDLRRTTVFPTSVSKAISFDLVGGFVQHDSLEPGTGYWLKFPGLVQSVTLGGTPLLLDTIPVNAGWNLIGTIEPPVAASMVGSIPSGIILGNFFGYAPGYTVADTLRPFRAYWVETSQAGKLILNGALPKLVAAQPQEFAAELLLRDAFGRKQTLYLARSGSVTDLRQFDLPPKPPSGAFDIRFGSDRMLEPVNVGKAERFPLLLAGAAYPLNVTWKSNDNIGPIAILLDGRTVSLTSGVPATILGGVSDVALSVGAGASVPVNFTLGQNYPNPFNPSTQIAYSLPEDAIVSLKVFTLLGQEVKTLLSGVLTSGEKVASWDGTNSAGNPMATGVYFYRLEVRSLTRSSLSFTSVRRMLLVR